jgi:tetratricopeptide (TPR) repeat protein
MRYVCVHCDHRFEAEGDEPPRRCPACMRAGAIQRVEEAGASAKTPVKQGPKRHLIALSVLAVLAAVAGYFMLGRRPTAGDEAHVGPHTASELQAALSAAQADAGELAQLLVADESIEAFAEQAAGKARTNMDKAEAITRAVRARASALAFVPWSLGEPRSTPVMTTKQVLATLGKDKGRAELYPVEVASLAVAALRAIDVPAMVAELHDLESERAPLDPSGYLGYFAVAVYPAEAGVGTPRLFDPYGGRTLPANAKHGVLNDPQVVGAALGLRALHEISYLADPRTALETSSDALALAGQLPSVRTVRGMVVLAGKQVEQGLQEFAAARQLRSDPARLHNLATAEAMTGDMDRANKDLQSALSRAPDYAAAHATLAGLTLMAGEQERALAELTQADKLAPDLTLVQWALADYWLRTGDRDRAIETAQRALTRRPSFDAQLRMGILLRQAGRYDDMRKVASELVARVPAYRKDELRELLRSALGPTALEDPDGAEASAAPEAPDDLQLGEPPQLGGSNGAPRLDDPSAAGRDGPKLRLGDSKDGYRLKLGR